MLIFNLIFTTFIETKDERKCYSCELDSYTDVCNNIVTCMPGESKCVTIELGNSQKTKIKTRCAFEELEETPEGCLCLDSGQFLCFETCSDDLCNDSKISHPEFDPDSCWKTADSTTTDYTTTTIFHNTTISSEESESPRYDLLFGITIPLLLLLSFVLICLVQRKINHNP